MRKRWGIIIVFCLCFLFSGVVMAQPFQGKKFELSSSVSYWNIKYKDSDETNTAFNLALRFGYFITKGLEIEPEFFLTIPDDSENTGYIIKGNLLYNFQTSEKTIIFILGGAGYGNGQPLLSWIWDVDTGITVYNLGAGVKYLIGNSAGLRIEYRFTKYSGEKTESSAWYDYTEEYHRTDHNLLLGLSIFF